MLRITLILLALGAYSTASQATTADIDPLANIRNQVIKSAPYKQWNLQTGAPNMTIGRTPGAGCEAISFFAADMRANQNQASQAKAIELADWVIALQARKGAAAGGVPSTPDLPAPSNAYYYAIDAAFCGTAMLDLHSVTGDQRYADSAANFGSFILRSMRSSRNSRTDDLDDRAPCEYVIQEPRRSAKWKCQHFVKNLVALPFLMRLDQIKPGQGYALAARNMRAALVPGLMGLWEYYEPDEDRPGWRRINGPYREENYFIFGDTIAYALTGLVAYEGASTDVVQLYTRIANAKGRLPAVAAYDGRIAFAGYLLADGSPDPASAYYDTVTIGLLQPVRRQIAPNDAARADTIIRTEIASRPSIGWSLTMDRAMNQQSSGDISTLSALGKALIN